MLSEPPSPPKVLIVDDHPNNLQVLSELFNTSPWEVLVATDGESAIEQASYSLPDLLLLDVMMPGMDGFQVCQHLKANPITQDIPIIFMTALADNAHKVEGFKVGAVDYITKPFHGEEVLMRVKTQLQLRQLHRQVQFHNQQLEQQVADRTAELSNALEELRQTQLSLVQREKMSALGELMAGIAHEINNPLAAIMGNVMVLTEELQTMFQLLDAYQQVYPAPPNELRVALEEAELDYLRQDSVAILKSLQQGADRIQKLVYSLRHFSRQDNTVRQKVDLHEGLESTLMLLRHRLKATSEHPEIQIVREYGDISALLGYPGPLNQVFMNLLANAIDALEAHPHCPAPSIQVRTFQDNQQAVIQIIDNGIGMSPEVMQRLRQGSFTTKPIGKGTGLGLSISRQIIEKQHGGCLSFTSIEGQGSTFQVTLPLD